mgnify:CR=1 FL=1
MNISEEHVTRAMARELVDSGCEIVAVHPPDGQGPFVIPKPPQLRNIERGSYHPDIVALKNLRAEMKLVIVECKVEFSEVEADIDKLRALASHRQSLLFALFRCKKDEGGPQNGFDYEKVAELKTPSLPIEFIVAFAGKKNEKRELSSLNGMKCFQYSFAPDRLH